jgi:UDP-N-acetylmuramoylalanine-D-glutamate ligase
MLTMVMGCTFFQNVDQSKLVVQIATMKVIEAQGSAHYQERAANVIKIGTDAKTWLDTNGVTLGFLRAAVEARIAKLNLAPSDQLLAGVLVDAAIAEPMAKIYATTLVEAVKLAQTLTTKGDAVLLSPACASFDQYKNFEERGKHFTDLVNQYF